MVLILVLILSTSETNLNPAVCNQPISCLLAAHWLFVNGASAVIRQPTYLLL